MKKILKYILLISVTQLIFSCEADSLEKEHFSTIEEFFTTTECEGENECHNLNETEGEDPTIEEEDENS